MAAEEMIEIAAAASQASATNQNKNQVRGAGALVQSHGGNGRHEN